MSIEAGVLELREQLAKCRLERDRLRAEKESFMIKKLQIEKLKEELRRQKEAKLRATSVFEEQKKSLEEALKARMQSVVQVDKAADEFDAIHASQFPYKLTEFNVAYDKLKRLNSLYDERNQRCKTDRIEIKNLQSQIDKKWKTLIAFLQLCHKNSKITDGVKPLLQECCDAYIDKLQCDSDDYRRLNENVLVVLQPSSPQKQNYMFACVDLISPISTAISKVLSISLFNIRRLADQDPRGTSFWVFQVLRRWFSKMA